MKQVIKLSIACTMVLLLAACGGDKSKDAVKDKREALEKLKKEKDQKDQEILKLQGELSKTDTSSDNPSKIKLVALSPIKLDSFSHYIDLQGRVDAENISYIAPRGQPALVKAVYVKQGDHVRKGQLLLKLDDAILRQGVANARQQTVGINSQLALARSVYQRRKNLWDQGVGTEVQLLQARTDVANLEAQLQSANVNIRLAQEQLNTTTVYSDVSGVADIVNIRVGEIFSGMAGTTPQIKIVNSSNLKVVGNIPENYLGSVTLGTVMVVVLPDFQKTITTKVSFVGASIDATNRGFVVEARLPVDPTLKPNQLALMKIRDYTAPSTVSIPLNSLQNDEKGKFVMVASQEKGKLFARKRPVTIGMLSGDRLEIKSGLREGEQLITEGYTGVYEGQQLTTGTK